MGISKYLPVCYIRQLKLWAQDFSDLAVEEFAGQIKNHLIEIDGQ